MAWELRRPIDNQGWTLPTLLEYVNARISDMELRNQQRFDAQTKSIDSRTSDMEVRQQQRFEAQTKAIDAAITAQRSAVDAALAAADKATLKAEQGADKRFELLNELKAVVVERDGAFMTRVEADALFNRNSERIAELTTRIQAMAPRDVVLAEYDRISTKVDSIADRLTRSEGKGSGYSASWGIVIAVVGLIVAAITIYLALK